MPRIRLHGVRFACTALLLGCTVQRERVSDSARASRGEVAPLSALRARTWELVRLGDRFIPPAPASARGTQPGRHPGPGSRPTIRFTAEPSVDRAGAFAAGGWSFCNGYGTAYTFGPGDTLRMQGFQSTLVGCDGPDSLETRFFRGLYETRRAVLDADTLRLITADGSRLTFTAVPDTVESNGRESGARSNRLP
jgi:hypothetical protein